MRTAALLAGLALLLIAAAAGVFAHSLAACIAIIIAAGIGWMFRDARTARTPREPQRADHNRPQQGDRASVDVAFNTPQDERRELESGLRLVCESVHARAGVLWTIGGRGDVARAAAVFGRAAPAPRPLRGDPLGWVAQEGTPLRIEPAPAWAGEDVSVIAMRLRQRENSGWLLTLELPHPAPSDPTSHAAKQTSRDATFDLASCDAIAAPLRLLVELQERRSDTDGVRRRLNSLLNILHRIPVATELVPAADELIAACMELTDATGGAVGLWDGDAGRVVCVRGNDGGPAPDAVFRPPSSEMGLAIRAHTTLLREQGSWKPGPTQIANTDDRWTARPRTFAAVPLATATDTTGVIVVWNSTERTLDSAGVDLIAAVAPYAALHLRHAREFGRMKETAETDALTGLRNRRAFDAALTLEASRYERYARPLSLIMIDLDHFKSVNDRHGHEAGDEVLRRVAGIVRTCVRDVDTAARFGGEELAVLLPETPLDSARDVAERIRMTIAATPVSVAQGHISVTASLGVACVPGNVAEAKALLPRADEALYAAKTGGRNRVVTA